MPSGMKPVKEFCGKPGRSGRKTLPVELAKAKAIIRAWNKVEQSVETEDVKGVALPIALRTMVEKHEGALTVKVIFDKVYGDKTSTTDFPQVPTESNSQCSEF